MVSLPQVVADLLLVVAYHPLVGACLHQVVVCLFLVGVCLLLLLAFLQTEWDAGVMALHRNSHVKEQHINKPMTMYK